MVVAEAIFIISVIVIAYTYVGYPALVYLLSRVLGQQTIRAAITPSLSVVITARNEEQDIAAKLENTLALDYPKDKLEIIVASDCSEDRTDEIVRGFAVRGVILCRQSERLGKTVAQNRGVRQSRGEIVVLSDATTLYEPDAVRQLVRNFADPEVGCVAGQLVYVSRSATAVGRNCRSYWGYEKFIKHCESRLGSLIGVSGCIYAVRRSCFTPLAPAMIDDFVIASEMRLQGRRTVFEPLAVATEDTNQRAPEEFRMRVRVIEQTMRALAHYRSVLSLKQHGMFAFQMISHKVMRYAVVIFFVAAFVSNAALTFAPSTIVSTVIPQASLLFQLSFIGQVSFYLAAGVGFLCDRMGWKLGRLGLPYYFTLLNLAVVFAFVKFIQGEAHVVWSPVRQATASQPGEAGR